MTIFVTNHTGLPDKIILGESEDSGFTDLNQVVEFMGEPVARGVRYVAYPEQYYSDYTLAPVVRV